MNKSTVNNDKMEKLSYTTYTKGNHMSKRINLNSIESEGKKDEMAFRNYRENLHEEEYDWEDANVEGVTVNGEPLDGHYFDRIISST